MPGTGTSPHGTDAGGLGLSFSLRALASRAPGTITFDDKPNGIPRSTAPSFPLAAQCLRAKCTHQLTVTERCSHVHPSLVAPGCTSYD
ncbi:hypothetical protein E2562_031288 [Oryza meyeriana var. granulata]|uniref:Uncharacterized protein n=1 Tax=Oryza meyeriana var. granulata TaxID=110450 RepID=A0A6G1CAC5_9ORYZ|nr:hypothetical protein E2562_031288 [Oryza meyeriana var. granulata]